MSCSSNIYNCLTCYPNSTHKYFLSNRCLTSCPNGYYQDDSLLLCLPCTQPCEYCSSSSVSGCLTCISGYTLHGSTCQSSCPETYFQNGTTCSQCALPCLTCSSESVCLSCSTGYSLYAGSCLASCLETYVSINQVCLECSSNCKTCSLVNFCTSCFTNTYLHSGQCVSPCPNGYF